MAIKPILFNPKMTYAILANMKTQTRRIVKIIPAEEVGYEPYIKEGCEESLAEWNFIYKYPGGEYRHWTDSIKAPCSVGDILYVRETWRYSSDNDSDNRYNYLADYQKPFDSNWISDEYRKQRYPRDWKWCPSMYMPKEAARIFLKVKNIRVERLQSISEEDVCAEGYWRCPFEHYIQSPDGSIARCDAYGAHCLCKRWYCEHSVQECFGRELWNPTITESDLPFYGWEANPWVLVIEFERISPDELPDDWMQRKTCSKTG